MDNKMYRPLCDNNEICEPWVLIEIMKYLTYTQIDGDIIELNCWPVQ